MKKKFNKQEFIKSMIRVTINTEPMIFKFIIICSVLTIAISIASPESSTKTLDISAGLLKWLAIWMFLAYIKVMVLSIEEAKQ